MTEHDFGSRSEFYTFAPETLQKEFPDFEILREVGKGSMGIVYEATRRSDNLRVALKVLPPSLTLTERALARFLKEGEVMARIEHDTIVKVHDHGRQGRLHFFCMEFVDGVSLQERLTVGPLPIRTAAEIGVQVARALQFAHDHGVLHRDVKPGNLMLRQDGRVAITDFGLARETGTGSLTESGAIVGTPMYMAPEQVVGKRGTVDARVDIYGLGATLYELVTGEAPFRGPTAQSVLKDVLEKDPPRPSRKRHDLPQDLEAVILQALEKEPARRYGSALEMAEDLQRFLDGERVHARVPSMMTRMARATMKRPLLTTLVLIIMALAVVAFGLLRDKQIQDLQAQLREVELDFNRATSLDTIGLRALTGEERAALLVRAREHSSEVIRNAPQMVTTAVPAHLWRARAHIALREYERALADLDEAERLLDLNEPRKDILTYRIETLQKLPGPQNRKRLEQDLTALLRINPGRETQLLVVDHLLIMVSAVSDPDRSAILARVERLLGKNSQPDTSARNTIANARLLELQGNLQKADEAISQATRDHPTDPVAYAHAARIYRRVGKADKAAAAESMARALSGEPVLPQGKGENETESETESSKVDMTGLLKFLRQVERLTEDEKAKPPKDPSKDN